MTTESSESSVRGYAWTALNLTQVAALDAFFEQLFPADEYGPGASSLGVTQYLDRALSGPYGRHLETYRLGLDALEAESLDRFGKPFAKNCTVTLSPMGSDCASSVRSITASRNPEMGCGMPG